MKYKLPQYSFYPEQVAQFMTEQGMIFEDETKEFETYIRGCA